MSNSCIELGLYTAIGPIIEGLRGENDRLLATCVVMALFKHNFSDYIKDVSIDGNVLTFTRKDWSTVTILLPEDLDDYVNNATLLGSTLTLVRKNGLLVTINLSSLTPEIDTSSFFANCEIVGNVLKFYNKDGVEIDSVSLSNFENSILAKFPLIPGYYYSTTKKSGLFNTLNTTYIGTTWDPKQLKPTSEYRYIYKVVSIEEYTLVASYKLPRDGYFYVLSSGNINLSYKETTDGNLKLKTKAIPSGVIGVIGQTNGNLTITTLDKYFIYLDVNVNLADPSSATYTDIKNNSANDNSATYKITGKDNTNLNASASDCIFYPSRFNNMKHDWDTDNNTLVEAFNDIITNSGFRVLFEIKYESSNVDNVDILHDLSSEYIIGDTSDGLRYTDIRRYLKNEYLGRATFQNNTYVASDLLYEDSSSLISDGYFRLDKKENWKSTEALSLIWSYIMTYYFNSNDPDSAISTLCYSDNTGWYTTWAKFNILSNSYGVVLNANTECGDGEVAVNNHTTALPTISPDNMPCSSFSIVFNAQIGELSTFGTIKLNIGGRLWGTDANLTPIYKYFLFKRSNNEHVILDESCILYNTTIKDCNFTIQYWGVDNNLDPILKSEHIKFENLTQ